MPDESKVAECHALRAELDQLEAELDATPRGDGPNSPERQALMHRVHNTRVEWRQLAVETGLRTPGLAQTPPGGGE